MRFAPEARPFVLPFAGLAGLLLLAGRRGWAAAAGALGAGVLLFFRDPDRRHSDETVDVLVAPAEGLVTRVDEAIEDPEVGAGRFHRIVTFLSVFDVHVQRLPAGGAVVHSGLTRGRKVAAFRGDAHEVNEKHLVVLATERGDRVGIRQIAGLVARRVVCYLHEGQRVERGQHLGVIKFGSRVDLLVPESYEVLVRQGDRVRVGATPMARAPGDAGDDDA